jgi:phenylacetaldehyde dehydrogenase
MRTDSESSSATGDSKRSLSPAVQEWLGSQQPRLMIDNKFVAAKSDKTFESINPATEEVIALVAEADKSDVDDAVKAARAAVEGGAMVAHERARAIEGDA